MLTMGIIVLIMSPWFWIASPDEAGTTGALVTAAIGTGIILLSFFV